MNRGVLATLTTVAVAVGALAPVASAAPAPTSRYIVQTNAAAAARVAVERAGVPAQAVSNYFERVLNGFAASLTDRQRDALAALPFVTAVTPDGVVSATEVQDVPPWGLDRIDQRTGPVDEMYGYDTTGVGVTAFIIDTGMRFDHVDFSGRAVSGWDFVSRDADASDCQGHGTHVAGTVGGEVSGVAKDVRLVSIRVLDCAGMGATSNIIAGLEWAVANKPQGPAVANLSLSGRPDPTFDTAIANTVAAGIPVVVAASNNNADACTKSPAREPSALTVAATNDEGARANFSNFGSCVDLFAPGAGIMSSTMTTSSSFDVKSGTSMAAPHVAGIVARYQESHPSADAASVAAAVVSAATPGVVGDPNGSPNLLAFASPPDAGPITSTPITLPAKAYVDDILSADPAWSPDRISYSYVWKRDGVPIADAPQQFAYAVSLDDVGHVITVTVTGKRSGSPDAVVTSSGTTIPVTFERGVAATIAGDFVVGGGLTAQPGSGWVPAPTSHAFQWTRDGVAISGATNSSYTLTAADAGKRISVTDTAGRLGLTPLTMTTSGRVVAPDGPVVGSDPVITGVAQVGSTVTAEPGAWSPQPIDLAYQWKRGGQAIPNATGAAYTVVAADLGADLTVSVTGSRPGLSPLTRTSAPALVRPGVMTLTPTPVVSGTASVGATLTATPGTWDAGTTLSYEWKRNGSTAIAGATGKTYAVKEADAGSTLTVSVTATRPGYTTTTRTSAPTTSVTGGTTLTGSTPTISGTAQVGRTLTANAGTWAPQPVAFAYQWKRDGSVVSGATAATYTPVAADSGTTLTVTVTGTKSGYTTLARTSAGVSVAPGLQTLMPTPTISGSTTVGSTLTANPGTWDAGTTLAYQWKKNNGIYISGATAKTYVLKASDAGATLTVTVTGTKPGYSSASKTSATTAVVTNGAVITGPTPTITGTATVGQKLTAVPGTWAPAPVTLAYQWKRNSTAISGATASTYTLVAADAGAAISVTVTGTKSGYAAVAKTSAAVTVKAALQTLMPTPTITGTTKVGSTLTAAPGTWDAGTTLTYQWKKNNGIYITGATSKTYVLKAADAGATLTVSVTSTKPGYSPATKTSATTAMVTGGTLTGATPTITGTAKVGQTLTATPGTWAPSPVTLNYQWKRAGVAISGATSATYKPVAADAGKVVTVTVTGTKAGYTTLAKTSAGKTVAR
ncbi:Serine protease, subtilisin family [Rathayibacter oskolensis]|uniref:Serine protease, subtilisin family n=1 Tax=Rathayibacter oskolensis TaxID=1891671 RepID=A0A1X7PIM3_9MICO|nr:S8 family serine peptidase [Rathayibacter oskolensis]SMH50526.1 Serine protease, subtilisin family [Rathayibacter oskolensis]